MSNILLAGYTEWIREEDLKIAFPDVSCVVTGVSGKPDLKSARIVNKSDLTDRAAVHALLHTWEFDEVLFFSESTSLFGDTTFDELKFLSGLLEEVKTLSSPRVCLFFGNNRQHIESPMEDLLLSKTVASLRKSCVQEDIDCIFLRIPWIYSLSENGADDNLRRWIASAKNGHELSFPVPASQEVSFISADDLALFIYRLRDRWVVPAASAGNTPAAAMPAQPGTPATFTAAQSGTSAAAAPSQPGTPAAYTAAKSGTPEAAPSPRTITLGTPITADALGAALEEVLPGYVCRYADNHSALAIPREDGFVRESYSYFRQHGIIEDLRELWGHFREKNGEENMAEGNEAALSRAASRINILSGPANQKTLREMFTQAKPLRIIRISAELLIGFLIMQGLLGINDVQVQFKLIDMRLLYIMIFGLMYNIPVGLSAAGFASLSLILAYGGQGISGLTLFYEPTNWFVFIVYFTLGAVCGYIRSKDRENLAFAGEESKLLREKYRFLRELFLETQQEKHEYRQQIISSEDSFGKIFRITQQLDVISPHLIFMHAMSVIEEIMENRTVTIYSVGRNRAFARLEAASRDMDAPRSLSLDSYAEVLDALKSEGIWTNRELKARMPMYVCGVIRDGSVVLLVMIWKAEFGQMTLYYSNLLKILTGLVSTSLLRSYDYQNATRANRYYEDTVMMKQSAFLEAIETAYSMNQAKIASYSLHRLESDSLAPEEISRTIANRIRENDVIGLADGRLFLLISQSTAEGVAILRERFAGLDIYMHDVDFEETISALSPETAEESHE